MTARAIAFLREKGNMEILLVERGCESAREPVGRFVVMDRGEVLLSGPRGSMVEDDVRRWLSV